MEKKFKKQFKRTPIDQILPDDLSVINRLINKLKSIILILLLMILCIGIMGFTSAVTIILNHLNNLPLNSLP